MTEIVITGLIGVAFGVLLGMIITYGIQGHRKLGTFFTKIIK